MGRYGLQKRDMWQDRSGYKAKKSENVFFVTFSNYFKNKHYEIIQSPSEFDNIYLDVNLDNIEKKEIYNPPIPIKKHGIRPDFSIRNIKTNKTLYIEVKRQDGWVEGGKRSDGRGNAHERSSKYFTPGLLKIIRNKSKITPNSLPFWIVFIGDITRDPCRVREITCWFDKYKNHFFFWRDVNNPKLIIEHFNRNLEHLLD